MRNFNGFISLRERGWQKIGIIGMGLLTLAGCSTTTEFSDDSDPTLYERSFLSQTEAVTVRPGEFKPVAELPEQLNEAYNKYPRREQENNWGGDIKNSVTQRPNRYATGFSEGDGSGADTVCEDLAVPKELTYIRAVTDSEHPAWITFNEDGKIVHLCYDANENPDTVMVWGETGPR